MHGQQNIKNRIYSFSCKFGCTLQASLSLITGGVQEDGRNFLSLWGKVLVLDSYNLVISSHFFVTFTVPVQDKTLKKTKIFPFSSLVERDYISTSVFP